MESAQPPRTEVSALLATLETQQADLAALQRTLQAQTTQITTLRAGQERRPRLPHARWLVRAALLAALATLLLSGSASASIPSTATGAIGMCYRTAGSMNLLYVLDTAQQAGCPTGMTQSSFNQNPLQVALLRWYPANLTGISVPVGGANLWVVNTLPATVSEL